MTYQKNGKNLENAKLLVLGMGNILMGDEGIGVRSVEYLEKQKLPKNIDLLDGGTGGFNLLPEIQNYSKVILIDATLDDNPPGTLRIIKPRFAKDFPKAMSTHDIGLKDLIESASILGNLPEIYLVVITIPGIQSLNMDLSEEITKCLPEISKTVLNLAEKIK